MPELNTFACEICGALRREVNRWWMVFAITEDAPLGRFTPDALETRSEAGFICAEFNAELWADAIQDGLPRAVACGEEHAQQLFARWLVSGSFDAPSQRPIAREPVVGAPLAAPEEGSDE
jgi:hypothetical protein